MGESRTPIEKKRLLIVDDEEAIREVLAEGLEAFGYETRSEHDPARAYDAVEQGIVDLVLSDIDMPGQSGLDLLKNIKAHDPDVDVIMVTGMADAETAVRSIREGASDYVTKPFNLDEVGLVVDRVLRQRRLVDENRAYQQRLEEMVAERTRDLEASYEATLQSLVTALDLRDSETEGHSARVVEYAKILSDRLGIEEPELTSIRLGAILHDVGKIGVSDSILRKPGPLDPDEWTEMRKHPEMGYRMLQGIPFLEPALAVVLAHQERWDGTGYPKGLRGDKIPLAARIFAVVDTFDAMTSDRPYRKALTIGRAREEVRLFAGKQFDPRVAEVFLSVPEATWKEIRERVHREVVATGNRSLKIKG
jgi:response regulator RpfG family c-di-GMP phosphodiesterase